MVDAAVMKTDADAVGLLSFSFFAAAAAAIVALASLEVAAMTDVVLSSGLF